MTSRDRCADFIHQDTAQGWLDFGVRMGEMMAEMMDRRISDAMLRERTNHDAVPAARVSTPDENLLHAASELGNPGAASRQGEVTGNTKEPAAWLVTEPKGFCPPRFLFSDEERAKRFAKIQEDLIVVPLYRTPTLTDAEREAVKLAAEWFASVPLGDTLRSLLERTK